MLISGVYRVLVQLRFFGDVNASKLCFAILAALLSFLAHINQTLTMSRQLGRKKHSRFTHVCASHTAPYLLNVLFLRDPRAMQSFHGFLLLQDE